MVKQGISQNNEYYQPTFDYKNYRLMTVRDYFIEYLFPDAIIYGMSYDEFWNKDPELFFSYRFSFLKKIEIDQRQSNYNAWLNGMYVYEAEAIALNNAFGKGKKQEYVSKPHDIFGDEKAKNTEENFLDTRRYWSRFKERSRK